MAAEQDLAVAAAMLEWVEAATDGSPVSEFGESFPVVQKVLHLKRMLKETERREQELIRDLRAARIRARAPVGTTLQAVVACPSCGRHAEVALCRPSEEGTADVVTAHARRVR